MRHFVAYHNQERMKYPLQEGDPLCVFTNKAVGKLMGDVVWFVESEGSRPKQFLLSSVFVINETGECGNPDFKYFARGHGHVLQPRIRLNELGWFPAFLHSMGRFSLGFREIADTNVIAELNSLVTQAGLTLT